MGNALYFVVADIFVPFFLRVGQHVQAQAGLKPLYLSFLPRDNTWLKQQVPTVLPRDVYTLDDVVVRSDLIDAGKALDLLAFMRAKHGGDEDLWIQRLNRVASYVHTLLAQNDIRVVVIWNGEDFVGRVLTMLARQRGIPTLFFENGYFPNTLQSDTQGINSSSSLVGKPFERLREECTGQAARLAPPATLVEVTPLKQTDLLNSAVKRITDPRYYKRFPEQRGSSWRQKKQLERAKKKVPADNITLPEQFVFVPLQVHDDTQVLLNCRHFNTVEAFFECAYEAIKRNLGPEMKIVVKEHPEDLCRYSYGDFRKKFPDVIWLKKFDVDKLLDQASMVVLINSSVGLQAVRRNKPTVVFGDSFYSRDEVAFCVHDLDKVDEVFARAKRGIDASMGAHIQFFIQYLETVYFFKGSWKTVEAECVASAASRVLAACKDVTA